MMLNDNVITQCLDFFQCDNAITQELLQCHSEFEIDNVITQELSRCHSGKK